MRVLMTVVALCGWCVACGPVEDGAYNTASATSSSSGATSSSSGVSSSGGDWPAPETLVAGVARPEFIRVLGDQAYVLTRGGILWRITISTAAMAEVTRVDDYTRDLALDETTAFFSAGGALWRSALLPASTAEVLVAESDDVGGVAVDGSHVYFASDAAGDIRRIPKAGGSVDTLVTGVLGVDNVSVDEGHVYFSEYQTGLVRRVSKTGGTVTNVAVGQQSTNRVVLVGTLAYWTTASGVAVGNKDGTGQVTVLVQGLGDPDDLSVDGNWVYFTAPDSNEVMRVSTNGQVREHLGRYQPNAHGLALTPQWVLWCNTDDGTVRKQARAGR